LYVRRDWKTDGGYLPNRKQNLSALRHWTIIASVLSCRPIDFLKVDVEGHELEVFKGATGMLSQSRIGHIQFEYGGCNIDARVLLKDLFDFFTPYRYASINYPNDLRHVPRYDQRLENFSISELGNNQ